MVKINYTGNVVDRETKLGIDGATGILKVTDPTGLVTELPIETVLTGEFAATQETLLVGVFTVTANFTKDGYKPAVSNAITFEIVELKDMDVTLNVAIEETTP